MISFHFPQKISLLGKFSVRKTMIDLDDNLVVSLEGHLVAPPPGERLHVGGAVVVGPRVVEAGLLLQVCVVPQQLVHT